MAGGDTPAIHKAPGSPGQRNENKLTIMIPIKSNLSSKITTSIIMIAVASMSCSCDSLYDDLDPCRTTYRLRFRYDYNINYADAFAHDVTSVNVWVFDDTGRFVWKGEESGEPLKSGDYRMELPLPEGKYDIVTWCGMKDNNDFTLDTYSPATPDQLGVTLNLTPVTRTDLGDYVSDSNLNPIFHSSLKGVELRANPSENEVKTIDVPLVKDTHYLQVMLQNMSGETMKAEDFSVRITSHNRKLDWQNNVVPSQPLFSYAPWGTLYGATGMDKDISGQPVTTVSTLLAELTTSRLMADSSPRLVVTRLTDNTEIIRIPLIDNLLLVKGHYYDMPDQEFLDRKGDFSLTFFLDSNLNWNVTSGIYIQNWAVVPVQETDL